MDAGIPMAPTIFAKKSKRSPAKLLAEIKARGGSRLHFLFEAETMRRTRLADVCDEAIHDGFLSWLLQAEGRGASLGIVTGVMSGACVFTRIARRIPAFSRTISGTTRNVCLAKCSVLFMMFLVLVSLRKPTVLFS